MKDWVKNLPLWQKIIGGIVITISLFFFLRWLFKKVAGFNQAELPDENSVGVNLTQAQAAQVRSIVQRLHTDMKGINAFGRDWDVYRELNELNDPLFLAAFNDFGNLYFSEGNGTLKQWITEENFTASAFFVTPLWWTRGSIKSDILERMDRLNLQ